MKITGAKFDSSKDNAQQQQQPSGLPMCDSTVTNKEGEGIGSTVPSDAPDEALVEAVSSVTEAIGREDTQVAADCEVINVGDVTTLEGGMPDSSDDDVDFLDLLVDSLDGEFDPELLI